MPSALSAEQQFRFTGSRSEGRARTSENTQRVVTHDVDEGGDKEDEGGSCSLKRALGRHFWENATTCDESKCRKPLRPEGRSRAHRAKNIQHVSCIPEKKKKTFAKPFDHFIVA